MNTASSHKNLKVLTLLENLANQFLSHPKTDKLEHFAALLANQFEYSEIEMGLSTIEPGDRFPSLAALRSAIYPHRSVRSNDSMEKYIENKIASEQALAAQVIDTMRKLNFTDDQIARYVEIWIEQVHGKEALALIPKMQGVDFSRPALLCLHAANYKSQRAIQIGKERMEKIRKTKPETRERFEVY